MSLDSELDAFFKSKKFSEIVDKEMKTNKNLSIGNIAIEEFTIKCANDLKKMLREEIYNIRSSNTGEAFLDYIIIDVRFQQNDGWVADVFFDVDKVTRESLYPDIYGSVYMPTLINNDYTASKSLSGYDRHGNSIITSKHWKYKDDIGFMKRVLDKMKAKYGTKVEITLHEVYDQ